MNKDINPDKSSRFIKDYVKVDKEQTKSPNVELNKIQSASENVLQIFNSPLDNFSKEDFIEAVKEAIEENIANKKELLVELITLGCKLQFLEEQIRRQVEDNKVEFDKIYYKIDTLEETTYRNIGTKDNPLPNSDSGEVKKQSLSNLIHKFLYNVIESPITTTLTVSLIAIFFTALAALFTHYVEKYTGKDIDIPKINITE